MSEGRQKQVVAGAHSQVVAGEVEVLHLEGEVEAAVAECKHGQEVEEEEEGGAECHPVEVEEAVAEEALLRPLVEAELRV